MQSQDVSSTFLYLWTRVTRLYGPLLSCCDLKLEPSGSREQSYWLALLIQVFPFVRYASESYFHSQFFKTQFSHIRFVLFGREATWVAFVYSVYLIKTHTGVTCKL